MKYFKIFLTALLLGVIATSCQKEGSPEPDSGREPQSLTFCCVLEGDSKLSIDAAGKTRWEPGDQILVHGKGSSNRATVTLTSGNISADGKSATITVSGITPYDRSADGITSSIYAAYPADAVSSGDLSYYTPFKDSNRPLMAAYNIEDKLIFRNCCGVISFSVSGDYDSYLFSGNSGETVGYGTYEAKIIYKKGKEVAEYTHYTKDPATVISGAVTTDGSTLNYICLPAGADFKSGFTIKLLKDEKAVAQATTGTAVNVKRNRLLPLGDIGPRLSDISSGGDQPSDPEAERLARLGQTPIISCYFTEYTSSSVFPTLEDVKCFTHINVGHARFVNKTTGDGGLEIKSPGPSYLTKLAAYKKDYPELKLLLFIGGWGKNADGFSQMAQSPEKRALFCSECVRLCDEYNLDGVDLDWEYPTYAASTKLDDGTYYYNGADPSDTKNFTTLVKELREALGRKRLISYAASDSGNYIDNAAVLEWVDYINVMTYSMGDPPYHNSPLYRSSLTRKRSCEESIEIFHNQGVPYNRMAFGLGFYGHGDGSVYPSSVSYAMAAEALNKGTVNGKSVAGYNIRHWDNVGKNCYLGDASGTMYASYEDAESLAYRVAFVKSKGMLGAFAWEYREDDTSGTLRKALHSLMTAE